MRMKECRMIRQELAWKVRAAVLLKVRADMGRSYVPAGVSNRHIHLSHEALETLFGRGYQLKQKSLLSQPGQFAAEETVTLQGPKGKLEKVRVLGPVRRETQVEISLTDTFVLGVKAEVRLSGNLEGTPGVRVVGPNGSLDLSTGVIVAARHLHISGEEAEVYGLKHGDVVSLRRSGPRGVTFENVLVRCGEGHELEAHLDVDEANAAQLKNGELLEVIR